MKSKDLCNHTIDSVALFCELYYDYLYIQKLIQLYHVDQQHLDFMNDLFLDHADAISSCKGIFQKQEQIAYFVAAISNLMQEFKTEGRIPEYKLLMYRSCKRGYSYVHENGGAKAEKNKKLNKAFADQATSFYETMLAEGYSKTTKLNGFWGRAFSGGQQKVSYNVYTVASRFSMGARFAQAKCKALFPYYPEYNSLFAALISPFLELDQLLSHVNDFINYDMNIESGLQKLLNTVWFDSAMINMISVRGNMVYQQKVQNANIKIHDMQSMAMFVEGVLTQANSWKVDGGPQSIVHNTILRMLK